MTGKLKQAFTILPPVDFGQPVFTGKAVTPKKIFNIQQRQRTQNGLPMEASSITASFEKLIKENDLPKDVFHSPRHSSITYKLKLKGLIRNF